MGKTLGELAAAYGCELDGDPDVVVERVATLANAVPGDLTFFANKLYRDDLRSTTASVVLLKETDVADCPVASLIADDPYLLYARITGDLYPEPAVKPGINAAATIDPDAEVATSAQVAANAVIEASARVGEGVYVGPGAVIGPGCVVGNGSRILANATLVRDVTIGQRCIIHPGAVLGSDGFGNAMGEDGWLKVPQVGGVRVGDDVEIGANTTIDCGAIDETVIGNGVRIDNLVQIGHNVQIGDHTAIAASAGVAGSAVIGKRCMLAGQSGIVGHISICDDVIVGGATMISKDITTPGFYTGSFPGEPDRTWKRRVARFRRLDELADRVTLLEKRANHDGE